MYSEGVHPARIDEEELFSQCRMTRGYSTGPGGQHRNKVASLVRLVHSPTGCEAQAGERREPEMNRKTAIRRLRLVLAVEVRTVVPRGDQRSELWRQRCGADGRIVCSDTHRDFPSMLSEALDMIEACDLDEKKASLRLACSMSQLVRFVKKHRAAFTWWNRQRVAADLHTLK